MITLQGLNRTGIVLLLLLVPAIYVFKEHTRKLDAQVRGLASEVARLQRDQAVLEAELGFLASPERIDRLARKHLGLREARADQYVRLPETAGPMPGPLLPPHRLPGGDEEMTATIP